MIPSPKTRFGKRLLVVFGLGVLPACARMPMAPRPVRAEISPTFDVQGHRGARGLLPENSIPAFRKAIELGVTTLELDLRVTSDRVLIVEHDPKPNGARCVRDDGADVPGTWFKDLSHADVLELDCGRMPDRRFPEREPRPGTRIPTFDEVLTIARDAPYPVRINAEIKWEDERSSIPVPEFVALTIGSIRSRGMEARTSIQSFSREVLVAVRDLAPEIPRVALVRSRDEIGPMLDVTGCRVLAPWASDLREEDVADLHARGIRVVPWTVNEVEEMEVLVDWGVDGIISDYPDRLLAVVERRKRP